MARIKPAPFTNGQALTTVVTFEVHACVCMCWGGIMSESTATSSCSALACLSQFLFQFPDQEHTVRGLWRPNLLKAFWLSASFPLAKLP